MTKLCKAAWLLALAMIFGHLAVCAASAESLGKGAAGKQMAPSIGEMLDLCSPFTSADGQRTLRLHPDGEVELTMEVPENVHIDKPAEGTWEFSPATEQVTVSFGRMRSEYQIFIYDSDTKCILARESRTNADLEESWFSGVDEDIDEPSPDPPF
jgi:hypothetical protein